MAVTEMIKMVQENNPDLVANIPEELYNLTQLAEVTLAAGKLSTTNISDITGNHDAIQNCDHDSNSKSLEDTTNSILQKNSLITTELCPPVSDEIIKTSKNQHNEQKLIPKIIKCATAMTIAENGNFFSSSDDDSNYYSHKIFDRKKSRRSTFSDHSTIRFDELSCSSIPSSCDDLNYLSTGGTGVGSSGSGSVGVAGGCSNSSGSKSQTSNGHSSPLKMIRENSMGSMIEDDHICPDCGKKYSTSSNLARHRQTHRSILDKKARHCPYCEKVYVSMPAYSMHVRTHNQGCKCDHCGKCFSRPWLLQGHIRTHTGEKPFKCATCNKAFADKSNLRAHVQTHSNTKPHACARCGKSFALKSYLYKHEESSCMRNNTKQEKERPASSNKTSIMLLTPSKMSTTKSTLASKILQKESQNLIQQQQQQQQQRQTSNSPPAFPETSIWDYESRNYRSSDEIIMAISTKNDSNDNNNSIKNEKSYTTLTTSPKIHQHHHNVYDGFARISVIRPPISSAPSVSQFEQQQQLTEPMTSTTAAAAAAAELQMNFYQENPVDFSPKNTFTHSTKTSPFELTSSYAMVA